eukprot:jgi/Mesvir1/11905/Mv00248-RA.1
MDKNHVHSFWGNSPAFDIRTVIGATSRTELEEAVQPITLDTPSAANTVSALQLGAADCRHSILTLCRSHRWHPYPANLELVVYESEIACIARHMLLMSVILHEELLLKERAEVFLELYWNSLLRQRTAEYMQERARLLADVVLASLEGKLAAPASTGGQNGEPAMNGMGPESELEKLKRLFDLSNLKYKDKDDLVDTFRQWSLNVPLDMEGQWDKRMRQLHGERFDFRKNMVDWDYHMRLEKEASIIHFRHFRDWRENGVAYQVRESAHTVPNRSLCSYVAGTAVHCVDVSGKERGRSVMKRGYWGDIVNSPYMTLGVVTEEASLLKKSNMQHVKTAVDVAEHNLGSLLHELTQGRLYKMPDVPAPSEGKQAGAESATDSESDSRGHAERDEAKGGEEGSEGSEGKGEREGQGREECGAECGASDVAAEGSKGDQGVSSSPGTPQRGGVAAEGGSGDGEEKWGDVGHEKSQGGDGGEGTETRAGGEGRQGKVVTEIGAKKQGSAPAGANGTADGSHKTASDGPLAAEVVGRCRVAFVTGDASKNLFTRAKFADKFDAVVVGECCTRSTRACTRWPSPGRAAWWWRPPSTCCCCARSRWTRYRARSTSWQRSTGRRRAVGRKGWTARTSCL